jgi:hypothetical protein
MTTNLIDVLRQVKPERVLFTTFTLSLSWFEAFVLPTLRARQSPQVDLLVDARHYRKLCRDTESAYAGTAFRISAVEMKSGGFFHPKIAYLQAEEPGQDVLVISSGNLTASGQGGNLEILDAICVRDHPHVFEEFSAFCTSLSDHFGIGDKASSSIQHFASRAHEAFFATSEAMRTRPRTAWLVHTLETPALSQFAARVETELRKPRILTVLSPYHTASGHTVGQLTKACGAASTRIALSQRLMGTGTSTVFDVPFAEDAQGLPAEISYVVEKHQLERVCLAHAKCFEVTADGKVLVMTGSVNATKQSLMECKNVEVSLIRKLAASPFSWRDHEYASYRPSEFSDTGPDSSSGVIDASLDGQLVTGQVRPSRGALIVDAQLWTQDRLVSAVSQVELTALGVFRFSLDEPIEAVQSALLKLMNGEEEVACGWLNVEAFLSKQNVDTRLADAVTRFSQSKATEEDYRRMLSHFRRLLSSPPPSPPPKKPRGSLTTSRGSNRKIGGGSGRTAREEVRSLLPHVLEVAPHDEVALNMLRDTVRSLLGDIAGCVRPVSGNDAVAIRLQQWVNSFSRPRFTEAAPGWVRDLYYGMATVALCFAPSVFNPENLHDQLKRILGAPIADHDWEVFETRTLGLPEFAAALSIRNELLSSALEIVIAQSASQMLEKLLIARLGEARETLHRVQGGYHDLDAALLELAKKQQRSQQPLKDVVGLLPADPQWLNPQRGCPICQRKLGSVELVERLRRTGYGFHDLGCKEILVTGVSRTSLTAANIPDCWLAEPHPEEIV